MFAQYMYIKVHNPRHKLFIHVTPSLALAVNLKHYSYIIIWSKQRLEQKLVYDLNLFPCELTTDKVSLLLFGKQKISIV